MTTGQRIRTARERKNMTQGEVAKRCKTTKQTIFKYENDIVSNIPYDRILLLSEALDVSIEYLFGWDEKKDSPSEVQLTEGEKKILELFRRIPEERQGYALEVLETLLKMQQKP